MKPVTLLLLGSLAVNAALVVVLVKRPLSDATSGATADGRSAAGAGLGSEQAGASGQKADAEKRNQELAAQTWSKLRGGELATLADRLRAAGFPPGVVRAIISEQVRGEFAERRKALMAGVQMPPFWKANNMGAGVDAKTMAAQRALGKEQRALLKQLLGDDAEERDPMFEYYSKRQYGDLPKAKIDQVQQIASDYNELRSEIYQAANGMMLPEDREKLSFLEKELHADLASMMTPQELQEYELRSSNVASTLRNQLTAFNPTEQEFRALFTAAQAIENQFGSMMGSVTNEQYRQRQQAITEQAKALLSPERFAEFQQSIDPQTAQVSRLVARLELPATTVKDVVAVQKDIQSRANAVRSNSSLSPEQRATQLATLSQEATTKLTATLGARGAEAYKANGGYWLQNLTQTPPVTRTPAPVTTTVQPAPKG